jgi:hypothetical protein
MQRLQFTALLGVLAVSTATAQAIEFIDFGIPGSAFAYPYGFSGNRVVGFYDMENPLPDHGFIYDGATWTTVDYPLARHNVLTGVSGQNVVGFYEGHPTQFDGGYIYDGTKFTEIKIPNIDAEVNPEDILGSVVVGRYRALNAEHGFIYEDGLVQTVDYPGAVLTHLYGIGGPNKYLGMARDDWNSPSSLFGFILDSGVFTRLPTPPGHTNFAYWGMDGDVVVGTYYDTGQGFIYSNGTYTSVGPVVLGSETLGITDIEGNRILGYRGNDNDRHGFIAIIPEPSTYAIALAGLIGLAGYHRRKIRRRVRP